MTERQEDRKVKGFTEVAKGITGLIKDNYLNSVGVALFLWEENLKVLNTQVERWQSIQQDYINAGRVLYEKLPKEIATPWNGSLQKALNDTFDRFVAFQKSYFSSVRSASVDNLTKETLILAQKNVERTFSLFDDYLNLFRS
jgi:hypothetical protein